MSLRSLRCVAAVALCAGPAMAAELVINRFDNAAELGTWRHDYSLPATISFDPTRDAGASASSGSMKVQTTFDAASADNKTAITNDAFATPTNVSGYTSLDADFFILPGSAESFNPGTDIHGYQQFAVRNTNNYDYKGEGGRNFGPSGQWFHVSVPVTGFGQPVDAMRALTLQLYGGPGHNVNGPVTFWVDNVTFVPEPGSLGLLAVAMLAGLRRRRRCR